MPRIFLLLLFLSLLACQPEVETIRIGSDRWPGHAPLFIADDLKLPQPVRPLALLSDCRGVEC